VYAVRILRQGRWLDGVANIGVRPTVDQTGQRKLEVHIFDFTEDCYGEDVEVRFEHFLRPEKKFDSLDELVAQIRSDSAQARELLACG
jgi:riboflavin kinase/FMN adenylyltransferase